MLAVVGMVAFAAAVAAQPGVPAKTGRATFTFGGKEIVYENVSGNVMQSSGFTTATLTFSKDGKPGGDHLTVSLMVQKPGPVDLNQRFGNGIGFWTGGKIITYEKGKSQCTMTVTRLTATSVEGTADCPVVHEMNGGPAGSLTNVKFSASTN
jgi:hypothetical protein